MLRDVAVARALERAIARSDPELTRAEREIFALAVQGRHRREIAQVRGVKAATVKKQIHDLLGKLNASTLERAVNGVLREALDVVALVG